MNAETKLTPKQKKELELQQKREAREAVYNEARKSRPMIKETADNWLKELTESDEPTNKCLYEYQIAILAEHSNSYDYEELYKQDWINDLIPWKRNWGKYYDSWDHGQKVEWHISEDIRKEKLKKLVSWAKAQTFNDWLIRIDYNLSDIDFRHFESRTADQLIRLGEKFKEKELEAEKERIREKTRKEVLAELAEQNKEPEKPTETE